MIFQLIPIFISVIALIISWFSYDNSKKVGNAQTKVAEETFKRLKQEETERNVPELAFLDSTEVSKFGNSPVLEIRNVGKKPIYNFSVDIKSIDNQDSKNICTHDYKFPLDIFGKGSSLKFVILVSQGGRRTHRITCLGNEFIETCDKTFVRFS